MNQFNAAQRRIHEAAIRLFAQSGSTSVTVSALADEAGVARGTIYNNLESTDNLFQRAAAQLSEEMNDLIVASYAGVDDPAQRLSIGIRLYARRAHEEPHWGRFISQFGMTEDSLRKMWRGPPLEDLELGVDKGRYDIRGDQVASAMGLIAGSTISCVLLVIEGVRTWRDAGSNTAELVLRALGVSAEEALSLATLPLPELAHPSD